MHQQHVAHVADAGVAISLFRSDCTMETAAPYRMLITASTASRGYLPAASGSSPSAAG